MKYDSIEQFKALPLSRRRVAWAILVGSFPFIVIYSYLAALLKNFGSAFTYARLDAAVDIEYFRQFWRSRPWRDSAVKFCPHGFRSNETCQTCLHFQKVRESK